AATLSRRRKSERRHAHLGGFSVFRNATCFIANTHCVKPASPSSILTVNGNKDLIMQSKNLKQLIAFAATPLLMAFAISAGAAQPMTSNQIDAQYDTAMKSCDGMKGNDKDVCKKEA